MLQEYKIVFLFQDYWLEFIDFEESMGELVLPVNYGEVFFCPLDYRDFRLFENVVVEWL